MTNDMIDCVFLTCFQSDFSFLASVLYYSRIRLHRRIPWNRPISC